jgi:beta-lactamase class C
MTIDPERLQRAFRILQGWLDEGTVTAVASVVLHHGRVAGEFYGGVVSPAPEAPAVNGSSLFHIVSIGKPMTALAVMLLVESGCIALDDPVGDILPGFRGAGRDAISVRQLLTHTSGLPQDPDLSQLPPDVSTFDELRTYIHAPPVVPPGSKVEYSNVGYGLLGLVIEDGQPATVCHLHARACLRAGPVWTTPGLRRRIIFSPVSSVSMERLIAAVQPNVSIPRMRGGGRIRRGVSSLRRVMLRASSR